MNFYQQVQALEFKLIKDALEANNWNQTHAAEMLRMNRTTLVEKMKKLGLREMLPTGRVEDSPPVDHASRDCTIDN